MGRAISIALAVIFSLNGLAMLFGGLWWYGVVPGVTATGPYNPHFVRDIGAVYLVAGASLAAFAVRPGQARPALAAMAGFLILHAAIHVYDAACGSKPLADIARDFAAIHLPAILCLVLVLRTPREPVRSGPQTQMAA